MESAEGCGWIIWHLHSLHPRWSTWGFHPDAHIEHWSARPAPWAEMARIGCSGRTVPPLVLPIGPASAHKTGTGRSGKLVPTPLCLLSVPIGCRPAGARCIRCNSLPRHPLSAAAHTRQHAAHHGVPGHHPEDCAASGGPQQQQQCDTHCDLHGEEEGGQFSRNAPGRSGRAWPRWRRMPPTGHGGPVKAIATARCLVSCRVGSVCCRLPDTVFCDLSGACRACA